jgi:hypothetical protein
VTPDEFVARLKRDVPEVRPLILEHLEDNDEILLHLLTAELRRHAKEAFDAGRSPELVRLLGVLNAALIEGDNDVENAIAVSFVEDTGWWDPAMQPFIEAWPPDLRREAARQQNSPPA